MKKLLRNVSLTFCLFLAACCFASAQTPEVENWQTAAPSVEEFSIEVPAAFSADEFGGKDEKNINRRYKIAINGTWFFVFSDAGKNSPQTKFVRDFAGNFQKSGKSYPAGNLTGEKFSFVDSENFYHTILFVKTTARSYVFQTVSPTENNPQVERFFASLQIKEKDSVNAEENSAPEKSSESETATVINQTEKSVGISSGDNGRGNGIGSRSETNTSANSSAPTSPIQTRNLILLSKPRAAYTDFARFYQITGSVLTRVTFLANGEIGTVTPITKLPFGLTNQAISAARGIRFEPAIKDGQPINVTKQVIYSFTLY